MLNKNVQTKILLSVELMKGMHKMKAVIMAGGEGTRLRPLTCNMPKPMAKLCGRPIIEYILDLLNEHNTDEAAITLRYMPHKIINHFEDESYRGIKLSFIEEDKPLGTAGSVKNASKEFNDDFIVISGDAMCDFDLKEAMKFHKTVGADATLMVKKISDPREYGLVNTAEDMTISGFVEKPCYSQAVSDLANTGIYILSPRCMELIPDSVQYDFAKDLFPDMLSKGMKLYAYEDNGYWCDIGDLETYVTCQHDMLNRKVKCNIEGERDNSGNIFLGSKPYGDYTLEAPVYIGSGVTIGHGAKISAGSVIDNGVSIGSGCKINGSVVLEDSFIGQNSHINHAVLCNGASVKSDAAIYEGAVLGEKSVVGYKATVKGEVKIWPGKVLDDFAVADENIKFGTFKNSYFDDDGISGETGVELTPELCAKIGSAAGSAQKKQSIGICCSNNTASKALKQAIASGILSTGCNAVDLGETYFSKFLFGVSMCDLPLSIYIDGGMRTSIKLVTKDGLPAVRATERAIEGHLVRGEYSRCGFKDFGEINSFSDFGVIYKNKLVNELSQKAAGISVSLKAADSEIDKIFSDALFSAGYKKGEDIRLHIDSTGQRLTAYTKETGYVFYEKLLALCCKIEFESGNDVSVPFSAPRIIDTIAGEYGRNVYRYMDCPADSSDKKARSFAGKEMFIKDALFMSAKILSYLSKKELRLCDAIAEIPDFVVISRAVPCNGNPGRLIKGLSAASSKGGQITEGVVINQDNGILLVRPLKRGTGIKIFAEAFNTEIAHELCDGFETTIKDNLLDINDRSV